MKIPYRVSGEICGDRCPVLLCDIAIGSTACRHCRHCDDASVPGAAPWVTCKLLALLKGDKT